MHGYSRMVKNINGLDTSQMALVEIEIVNQYLDDVVRDRKVTLSGMIGTLGYTIYKTISNHFP